MEQPLQDLLPKKISTHVGLLPAHVAKIVFERKTLAPRRCGHSVFGDRKPR
jgi:hypothetical protein